MSFEPIVINKFQGLNSTFAPELLQVGEARDILNLRQEKIGKLVNRNGVTYGLYTIPDTEDLNLEDYSRLHDGFQDYLENRGVIGIGEYSTDGYFDFCDTDKFMVYAIRSQIAPIVGEITTRYMSYLFSPMTGIHRNKIFNFGVTNFRDSGVDVSYINQRDKNAQDLITDENRDYLYSPPPGVSGVYPTATTTWVDAFVQMNQYNHYLVISDRTNGDTVIEDEYNLRTGQECLPEGAGDLTPAQTLPVEHSFRIRPNSLDGFDIDVVDLQLRVGDGEENDAGGSGIETAMALYQFEVEKDIFKNTIDYFEGSPSDAATYANIEFTTEVLDTGNVPIPDVYPNYIQPYVNEVVDKFYQTKQISEVPLHIRQILPSWTQNNVATAADRDVHYVTGTDLSEDGTPILRYEWNETKQYRYSNIAEVDEFDNILKPVRLVETKLLNQENEQIKSYGSDVFLWNDLQLPYYPTKSITGQSYLLTDLDKEFDRTQTGLPRIVEFVDLEGRQREVPLSGWKYRFVWDFGNGILSAPSTDLLCPDMLWTAYRSTTGRENIQDYHIEETFKKIQNGGVQLGNEIDDLPPLLDGDLALTDIGYGVWKIKNGLYFPEHIFGGQVDEPTRAELDAFFQDTDNEEKAENFGTLITCVGAEIIKTEGYFCEGITVLCPSIINLGSDDQIKVEQAWQYAVHLKPKSLPLLNPVKPLLTYLDAAPFIITARLPLYVPLIPRIGNSASFNSVFDFKGKLRTGYLNADTISTSYTKTLPDTGSGSFTYQDKILQKQIILTGYNSGINFNVDNRYKDDIAEIMSIDAATFAVGADTQVNPYVMLIADLWNGFSGSFTFGTNTLGTPDPRATILKGQWLAFDDGLSGINYPYWGNFVCSEAVLSNYATRTDNGIYLNIVCDADDINNSNSETEKRIATLLRYANQESDRLTKLRPDIPTEVVDRLILSGYVPIELLTPEEEFFWQSQYQTISGKDIVSEAENSAERTKLYNQRIEDSLEYDKPRYPYKLQNAVHPITIGEMNESGQFVEAMDFADREIQNGSAIFQEDWVEYTTQNVEVNIYLEGERLLAIEQLTSIFPSSFLFNAPRLGISIDKTKIPSRAKKLLIYRTVATHNNGYDPNSWGLVEEIDIQRRNAENATMDNPIGTPYVVDEDGKYHDGIYYFDEVKDINLDFDTNIEESEGLRKPIKSRFNLPLNERMYYANFKQEAQPEAPRKSESKLTIVDGEITEDFRAEEAFDIDGVPVAAAKAQNTHYAVFETVTADDPELQKGFAQNTFVQYAYAYEDITGILSQAKETDMIDPTYNNLSEGDRYDFGEVVLYYLPNGYNTTIKYLNIYRRTITLEGVQVTGDPTVDYETALPLIAAEKYYKIGKIDEKNLGIFGDDYSVKSNAEGDPVNEMGCTHAVSNIYESGVMYSEPYRPDFIKQENFNQYRTGDGDQITGLASLYGNLVIFKENSIHRVAVQGEDALPSRTDEVSPDVGCIAPNTLLSIDNTLYFVSTQGIMKYDNNEVLEIDEKINEDIRTHLRYLQKIAELGDLPSHRYITAGYNPEYREMYFNFPMVDKVGDYENNEIDYFHYERKYQGHIYIFNLTTKFWTKFDYCKSVIDPELLYVEDEVEYEFYIRRMINGALSNSRLYYTNSLGEMRSGDIIPNLYSLGKDSEGNDLDMTWAGIYIETPYRHSDFHPRTINSGSASTEPYLSTDDILDNNVILENFAITGDTTDFDFSTFLFPSRRSVPVKVNFKSQFVTLDRETILKRINRIVTNLFSEGNITLTSVVNRRDVGDERIENSYDRQVFTFKQTKLTAESNPHPITLINDSANITNKNVLTIIPEPTITGTEEDFTITDDNLKGISFSLEIDTEMKTQINEITFYLRPIHLYLQ